ncbi:DUF192 domain-containing protein [Roseovarius atlanticus]|uniref:DUF192 domain-containing protein n=1 Tax=Roseovarius atlanticus TaxID=1641875 RepID=UPI001C950349|nr:DUF192 domain-containing protein [Roseovarius atlanticus]MBY6123933.1 DUF192 domain-containing protein [Roseovarius atlanticus]MBY6148428.1 DUF192 domain-containing protein [Roseovarius atlanticus]
MGNGGQGIQGLLTGALALLLTAGAAIGACRDDKVDLRGDWGSASFTVELADDRAERAQGLMNRDSMARSAGMLFAYPAPRPVRFWMRNTLIPLDMIFLDDTGTVQKVHHEAQPLDESLIYGGDAIQYVLEINGGMARQLGISEGTELRHPAIAAAAWPCDAE